VRRLAGHGLFNGGTSMRPSPMEVTDTLRHRERATASGLQAIDVKIDRLRAARAERAAALNRIRTAIARATLGQPDADDHENK
jgi:hypothetical protein